MRLFIYTREKTAIVLFTSPTSRINVTWIGNVVISLRSGRRFHKLSKSFVVAGITSIWTHAWQAAVKIVVEGIRKGKTLAGFLQTRAMQTFSTFLGSTRPKDN
jgi:hypothetical protein